MDFNNNKPIYLQLADRIMDMVARGELKPESRLLSVREFAAQSGVNPNTVMRTFAWLQEENIIFNKRGVGFFISEGAGEKILNQRRKDFIEQELPEFVDKMITLGVSPSRFTETYNKYFQSFNRNKMNNLKLILVLITFTVLFPSKLYALESETSVPKTENVSTNVNDTVPEQYGELDEFVFVQKKDLVTTDGAKMTYDMENDDSSKGQSLLDALRKVPMVTVDGQDNIYIRGNQNFKIYVNGKEDPMLTSNASRIFKSMPAESVNKIEVITEPGAKYDAEGTGGILNLITETKQSKDGYMGSASLSLSSNHTGASLYGRIKYDKVTADLSLNYTNNSFQKTNQHNETEITDTDSFLNYKVFDLMDQKVKFDYGNVAFNISWEPNQNNLFTAGANISLTNVKIERLTDLRSVFDRNGKMHTSIFQNIDGTVNNDGANANVSYRHLFSEKGNSLLMGYQFNFGSSPWKLNYQNEVKEGDVTMPDYQLNHVSEFNRSHLVTTDYTQPIGNGNHRIDMGIKGVFRRNSRNTESYYWNKDEDSNSNLSDSGKTIQSQDIYAAYLAYNGSINNVAFTAGLRYERTQMWLSFPNTEFANVATHLNDLVPNAAISYQFGQANNLRLAYQMRINRPTIAQINPVPFQQTQTAVQIGNPNLESEHFNSVSLTYSNFGPKLGGNVAITYYQSNNTIESYSYFKEGVSYETYGNFGKNKKTELSGFLNWNINQKMSLSVNGALNYTDIKSGDGKLHNSGWAGNYGANYNYNGPFNMKYFAYGGQSMRNIQLQGKNWGWYYYGIGISKGFLKDQALKLSLNATNFLQKNMTFKNVVYNGSQTARSFFRNRAWSVGLTVSWDFGHLKEKVKETGADTQFDDKKASQSRPGL